MNNQDRIRLDTFIKKTNAIGIANGNANAMAMGLQGQKDGTGCRSWAEYRRFLVDETHSLRS